ncbi:hypothetical protein LSH36_12g36192 [Paralvinella palmiformis]|uniref:Uncharacterized protein n=1 Tax=Paralvinella palmiformis TaxID=53620 RepID=A0AAD9NHX6_9ANNE|nr:hypothetical protein LSH36_12g36192 [Paralvinella palmiformis]
MNYDDPTFIQYMEIIKRSFDNGGNSGIVTIFPSVRFLPGDLFGVKQLKNDADYLKSVYKRIIDDHKMAAQKGQTDQ